MTKLIAAFRNFSKRRRNETCLRRNVILLALFLQPPVMNKTYFKSQIE
jgi:hypothetical protein